MSLQINKAKREIEGQFAALLNGEMLSVKIDGGALTLSGQIIAVQAIEKHIMQKYYPQHCKPMERKEFYHGQKAKYTYKF